MASGLRGHKQATANSAVEDCVSAAGDGYMSAVWRTSSYLETVQWELDVAHEALRQAVQQAARCGASQSALLQAANMTPDELATALLDTPPGDPAAT